MKFKYSAFIENTSEMREWLEELGYRPYNIPPFGITIDKIPDADIIYTGSRGRFDVAYSLDGEEMEDLLSTSIDCRSNHELFKAITAMRDDSDYMQWFYSDKIWFQCSKESVKYDVDIPTWAIHNCRKATLGELISHFKIEEI